jgi:Domain of unknown function (DUF6794)
LKSIPFDSEFPSLRGKTYVYRVGTSNPLYVFDRGFDSVEVDSNNLILSNDGTVIFYVIPWEPDERREGLKSITIYKDGKIVFPDFPKLKSGRVTAQALADYLGMKAIDHTDTKNEQYKWYHFEINSSLRRDGSVEIEEIDVDPELPKEKVIEFFKKNKFETSSVLPVFEKWYLGDEYFFFRKRNIQIARAEKQQEKLKQRKELETRLTLDTINGVYIPKDLDECFSELDKLLPEVDRGEMQALPKREDMIQYHMGLGMWIRNNWGLWGGSRLQKYFNEKGLTHPDNMSGLLLNFYYDWLHGQNDNWKAWEKNPTKGKW